MSRHQSPLTIEYILLGLLIEKPMSGYDLFKEIVNLRGISLVWHVKQSQLYAILEKIEKEGYIVPKIVSNRPYPFRKEYIVTEKGQEVFSDWVCKPVSHGRDMRQEFLARLYFARFRGELILMELLQNQKMACQKWITTLISQKKQLIDSQQYEKMVFDYRIFQVEAMLHWLDQYITDHSLKINVKSRIIW
jgi:DNA-binding PadR family transcriptional regulator